ncbi:MAG: hypothetical protein GY863_03075 [bacterium]|nr:hypothetical protein [bacterium]
MLDEQFFGNSKFHSYLNENFVAIHAYKKHPQAGDDLYKILGDKFGITNTPTVIIMKADLTEFDRIIGFDNGAADEYKTKVIDAYTASDNYLNLLKKYEDGSDNLDLMLNLANKLRFYRKFEMRIKMLEKIIANPKSKTKMTPFGRDGAKLSAIEYAEREIKRARDLMQRYENRR